MSLLKWTLAMAGTAVGLRYLSDRHRRRLGLTGSPAPQVDRDDARSPIPEPLRTDSPSDNTGGLGTSLGGIGGSVGNVGTAVGHVGSTGSGILDDDLLSPGTGLPGSTPTTRW